MLRKIKQISKKILIVVMLYSMLSIYLPILSSISFALDSISTSTTQEDTDISTIVSQIPKYYVFDMGNFHNQECSIGEYTSQQLESYIKQVINDDSVEISVDNLEGGGNFTFMEWSADVNIYKNQTLYDTVHFGWDDGSYITAFALITIPSNIEETEEAHIEYAQDIIENQYNWTYPYRIEKSEQLKDKDIVLLNTEKFGTVKYQGEDILSNLYTFTPEDDIEISEPLLLMQEEATEDTDNDISNIVNQIPKYYVFDIENFHNQECSIGEYTSQQLESYIKQVINDDSVEISVDNLEGGGNFTFMEWSADVNIYKNQTLYDTVHFGWDDGSYITVFALITIPANIEKTEEAHIEYAQDIIENQYNWTYPYRIEKSEQLKDKDIVLLDTEKFGTVKYYGEDILSNLYTFTPEDDIEISEPLLIMQEDNEIQLSTPTEVVLGEDLYGTWTAENFTFADQIGEFELDYKIVYGDSEKTGYTNSVSRYSCSNPEENVVRVYLKDVLNQAYTEAGYTREKVQISYRVRAITNDTDMYKDSEYSEYSNFISFAYDGKNPLDAPKDVTLSEEFKGSWTKVDNADFYSIEYKIKYNGCEKIITADSIEQFNLTENNGVLTTDLGESLKKAYTDAGYTGEKVQISYRIAASVRYYDYTLKYTDSLYSEYSNELYYKPNADIPTFNISGIITSYNSDTDNISIQLYKEDISEVFVEIDVKGNNTNYTIQDVLAGNYIIKFIKNNHVTREYSITVDSTDVIQNAGICLIGDVNGDGKINNSDVLKVNLQSKGNEILDEYQLLCADVSGDGKVTNSDVIKINLYATGKITSW